MTTLDTGAQLGLATTEELFRELIARLAIQPCDGTLLQGTMRGLELAEMLGSLSAPEREYRTVG